jgi:hypothetical protein
MATANVRESELSRRVLSSAELPFFRRIQPFGIERRWIPEASSQKQSH